MRRRQGAVREKVAGRYGVKGFMKIVALMVGACMVLGCQGSKEAASSEAPSEAAAALEESEKPATEPAPSDTEAEAPPASAILVSKVMGLTQTRTVEATETGIKITLPLEVSPKIDDKSTPRMVSDAMMFAVFYNAPLLYSRTDDVDELQQVFTFLGDKIGEINTTRASFESMGYEEAMAGVTNEKARRRVYRKLLAKLPKGAVNIKKKYRP
ncbi:MAG: hypothetical protein WBM74_17945 [Polyangiales bacterium]